MSVSVVAKAEPPDSPGETLRMRGQDGQISCRKNDQEPDLQIFRERYSYLSGFAPGHNHDTATDRSGQFANRGPGSKTCDRI